MIRLVIFGGRKFNDWPMMNRGFAVFMRTVGFPDLIISGAARGADRMGEQLAEAWRLPVERFAADWSGRGRAAGSERNQRMITIGQPTHGLAMPGGAGTADMLKRCALAGIPVILGT